MLGRISKVCASPSYTPYPGLTNTHVFSVAYKRFADNVPLAIDVELVQGAERGILLELYKGLGINGEDGQRICQELAMESPQVADRRTDLMNKHKRLQAAKQELLCIGF